MSKYLLEIGTEELAYKAAGDKWTFEEIQKVLRTKVYYNVASFTEGDIVFLFNLLPKLPNSPYHTKAECMRAIVNYMEDIKCKDLLFPTWLSVVKNMDFDFTPYV